MMNKLPLIVSDYWKNKDYQSILSLENEILSFDKTSDYFIQMVEPLIISKFYHEDYHEISNLILKLSIEEIESFLLIFYGLVSIIGDVIRNNENDIYQGISLIKKYKLLNSEKIKQYREIDGANYLNLLCEDFGLQKALIICLFIEKNYKLDLSCQDFRLVLSINYFELIDSLYELGYNTNIIRELTNIGHNLFDI